MSELRVRIGKFLLSALCSCAAFLLFANCGARTGLELPPGRPSPDIVCSAARIPRMTFSLGFDDTVTGDPHAIRVTWILRDRCLNRTSGDPAATPSDCPRCFLQVGNSLTVIQENGAPVRLRWDGAPRYSIENPAVGPRRFSFEVVNAPSARWCVDGYVEYQDGRTVPFGPVTRLLTTTSHGDTGFMVTRNRGPERVVAEFIAEHTCFGH